MNQPGFNRMKASNAGYPPGEVAVAPVVCPTYLQQHLLPRSWELRRWQGSWWLRGKQQQQGKFDIRITSWASYPLSYYEAFGFLLVNIFGGLVLESAHRKLISRVSRVRVGYTKSHICSRVELKYAWRSGEWWRSGEAWWRTVQQSSIFHEKLNGTESQRTLRKLLELLDTQV